MGEGLTKEYKREELAESGRRRRILPVLVAAAIAAACALTGCGKQAVAPAPSPSPQQPEEMLVGYFEGIARGSYDSLYDMLSESSRQAISRDGYVEKNERIYEGIEAKNLDIEIVAVTELEALEGEEGRWQVAYRCKMDTVAGAIVYDNQAIVLRNGEGKCLLDWSTEDIFPQLGPGDKVRVNTLRAERGQIFDRNGQMLAGKGVASAIGLVPGKMEQDGGLGLQQISQLLEMPVETIEKRLNASYVKEDTFVQLKIVPKTQQELKDALLLVPGVKIIDAQVRHYPLGEKAAHLVGYVQSINAEELAERKEQGYHTNSVLGKTGLEKIYEEQLRAVDGVEILIVDAGGQAKVTLAKVDKRDGHDLVLTVDARLQSQLYDQFSMDKGCSVAMNPKTGEVLALVSTPSYDNNAFVLGLSESQWKRVNEDENLPLYNRFKAALCPGSVFKGVTAAVGMETGAIDPAEDFGYSGLKWRKDDSWGGYYVKTTKAYKEAANLENALVYSDNIYFAKAALKMGGERFAEELIRLGFEERIPFEYGLYSSILSATETFTSEIQLADSGFGQGEVLTNPVHLASIYSAFVNGGDMPKPHLVQDGFGAAYAPWVAHAFSPETAETMRDALVQVIERGSGKEGRIDGMLLGGKTGTAEIKMNKEDLEGTELGWFVLFTADDQAKSPLVVVSMVEDVKDRGGSGYVIPGVRAIFEGLDGA